MRLWFRPLRPPARAHRNRWASRSAAPGSGQLDEFEWRFNNRDNPYLFRDTLVRLLNSPKMEFKKLTSVA